MEYHIFTWRIVGVGTFACLWYTVEKGFLICFSKGGWGYVYYVPNILNVFSSFLKCIQKHILHFGGMFMCACVLFTHLWAHIYLISTPRRVVLCLIKWHISHILDNTSPPHQRWCARIKCSRKANVRGRRTRSWRIIINVLARVCVYVCVCGLTIYE